MLPSGREHELAKVPRNAAHAVARRAPLRAATPVGETYVLRIAAVLVTASICGVARVGSGAATELCAGVEAGLRAEATAASARRGTARSATQAYGLTTDQGTGTDHQAGHHANHVRRWKDHPRARAKGDPHAGPCDRAAREVACRALGADLREAEVSGIRVPRAEGLDPGIGQGGAGGRRGPRRELRDGLLGVLVERHLERRTIAKTRRLTLQKRRELLPVDPPVEVHAVRGMELLRTHPVKEAPQRHVRLEAGRGTTSGVCVEIQQAVDPEDDMLVVRAVVVEVHRRASDDRPLMTRLRALAEGHRTGVAIDGVLMARASDGSDHEGDGRHACRSRE